MFANPDAYNYTPFPGTSSIQQANLQRYDSKYSAAAKKLKEKGYTVVGNNYFEKVPDANNASGYRLKKVGKVTTNFDNQILKETAATAQPPGLPADYKETEAKAFVDARRASGEVAGLPADYKKTELKAGETAEAYNPVAGLTASGRGESRTNVNDVDQTGTNTGFKGADYVGDYTKANTMLKNLGITGVGYGTFESNALQGGRPGVNINHQDKTTVDLPVEEAESYSSQKPGAEKPLFTPTVETKLTGEANFKVTDPIIVDASPKMGTSAAYMEQFKRDDLGSIEGLRAAEASKGLLYASGQYWIENPKAGQEGESDFEKITKEQYNAIKNSDQHAQEFAADKIKQTAEAMKNTGEEPIASSPVESPVDMNESPAKFEVPLTDMPSYTEKDHTGRFNIFRRS